MKRRWVRVTGMLSAAAVLALVFQAYLDPHFVVAMAGRFLSCF